MFSVVERGLVAALLGVAVAVSGCSGGSGSGTDGESETPTSAAGSPTSDSSSPIEGESIDSRSDYPDGVPDSIELTSAGTNLPVGETARVAFTPAKGSVGVLAMTVTKIEHTSFKISFQGWQLANVRGKNPYFVHVRVRNIGEETIPSDALVPLYALNDSNALVMNSTFGGRFAPCTPSAFPAKFKPGSKADLCLVYLLPDKGELMGVAFRHDDLFDPIVWTGTPVELTASTGTSSKGDTSSDTSKNKNSKNKSSKNKDSKDDAKGKKS